MEKSSKIVLTDWPKYKHIRANCRGMETPELLKILDSIFHMMMCSWSSEAVGGWIVEYYPEDIKEELKFRKVEIGECGCSCKGKMK